MVAELERRAPSQGYNGGVSPMLGAPIFPANTPNPLSGNIPPADAADLAEPKWPGAYKWDKPLFYVIPSNPQSRPGEVLTVDALRIIADRYDIIRTAFNFLIFDAIMTPRRWKPKKKGDKRRRTLNAIEAMEQFTTTTGGLGGKGVTRQAFEYSVLEDLLVLGAPAIWLKLNRAGVPVEAVDIDAATIRPRVNAFGWPPNEGDHRYEQWIYGTIQALFYDDDLIYSGIYKTSRSPYYKSTLEWLLEKIMIASGYDQWNMAWLKDGNTSDAWFEAPETWTMENLQVYTAWLDALTSGDSASRQKIKLLAPGAKPVKIGSKRDMEFIDGEKWLARRVCALVGVHMSAMGFEGDEYAADQANSARATSSFGTGRLLLWLKSFYDDLACRMGCDTIELSLAATDLAAAAQQAEIDSTYVAGGIKTPNEVRDGLDMDPYESPEDDDGADDSNPDRGKKPPSMGKSDTMPECGPADRLWMNGTMSTIEDLEQAFEQQQEMADTQHDQSLEMADKTGEQKMQQAKAAKAAKPTGANNNRGSGKVQGGKRAATARSRQATRK